MNIPYNKHHYPKQTVGLTEFSERLNKSLTLPFTNVNKLKEFYDEFIRKNYSLTLHWVETNGYDTVEEWAEEYFKDWDFDLHSTILKSVFKNKYNNIKPVISVKQIINNAAIKTIDELNKK